MQIKIGLGIGTRFFYGMWQKSKQTKLTVFKQYHEYEYFLGVLGIYISLHISIPQKIKE